MSRGLGKVQRDMLAAMLSLEETCRERDVHSRYRSGEHDATVFNVWAIVQRLHETSPDIQRRDLRRKAEADIARKEATAKASNDPEFASFMRGMRQIAAVLSERGRWQRRRTETLWMEDAINPSRVLAGLERRGLVYRFGRQGGAGACLTQEGREIAVSVRSPSRGLFQILDET